MKKFILFIFLNLFLFSFVSAQSNNENNPQLDDLSTEMQAYLEKIMGQMDAVFDLDNQDHFIQMDTFFSRNWHLDRDSLNSFKSDFNSDLDEMMTEMKAFMEQHISQFSEEDFSTWDMFPFEKKQPIVPAPEDLKEDQPNKNSQKTPIKKKKQRETYSL